MTRSGESSPLYQSTCFHLRCEDTHMRKLIVVFILLGFTTAIIGCEASGKVDDDGVKAKVDTK